MTQPGDEMYHEEMARLHAQRTPEQRRIHGGCGCHGMTFCPDLVYAGISEEDVPIFIHKNEAARLREIYDRAAFDPMI